MAGPIVARAAKKTIQPQLIRPSITKTASRPKCIAAQWSRESTTNFRRNCSEPETGCSAIMTAPTGESIAMDMEFVSTDAAASASAAVVHKRLGT